MYNATNLTHETLSPYPLHSHIDNLEIKNELLQLIEHLDLTGKICPKPWYWQRFFMLYQPRYEPCWLSDWWKTPKQEKKELFIKQLHYLAYRTERFKDALHFIRQLEDKNWLLK